MKMCFKCGEAKPISEFYRHSEMADGRLGKCKECTKRDVHLHRAANIESVRAYDRERGHTQHRIEKNTVNVARYRAENPEKYKAHGAVNNAIRDGKLDRQPCEVCGVDDGVHAHHDDYSRPLEVRFFCPVHHAEHHKAMREVEAENAALA